MDLHQLKCLVTVAKEKTVSNAAKVLMFSQPALTRTLKNLEDELGYPLFERKNNRLILNDTGKIAVEYANKVLLTQKEMIDVLTSYQNNKQRITIGSCAPAPLWGLKHLLHHKYPNIPLDSSISQDNVELIEGFNHYQYSLLILDYPINDPNLISKKLFDETLHVAFKLEDPLSHLESITFEQLNKKSFLTLSKTGYWLEICHEKLPDSLIIEQNDISAYKILQESSTLPTFRTNLTIPKFKNIEKRIYVPISNPEASLSFYVIYRKEDQQKYDFIAKEISSIPWKDYRKEDPF